VNISYFSVYKVFNMKFILGRKIEMTQVWRGDDVVPVTRVAAGPCTVVQIKDTKKDGYEAVQIGYGEKKPKNISKPQIGHMKNLGNFRYLKEFRLEKEDKDAAPALVKGAVIAANTFSPGDTVEVTGVSKGKGFQGVVKRHGFSGSKKTHGNKDQLRMGGSIGSTGPAHVFKGTRMGGRMGGDQVTTKNLEIIEVDLENNILLIKGSVPGARNSLVLISGKGELKIGSDKPEIKEEKIEETNSEEAEKKEENGPAASEQPAAQPEEAKDEPKADKKE
jgi:large subunit ribosomal protein L3